MSVMYTILVPVDGSPHSLKALHIAGDLAEKYSGRIALLHVLARNKRADDFLRIGVAKSFGPKLLTALTQAAGRDSDSPAAPQAIPEPLLRSMGERILQEARERVQHRDLQADILEIADGDPVEAILVAAKSAGANLIVMGCRGLSGSSDGPFGSISQAIFAQAPCTCISVK